MTIKEWHFADFDTREGMPKVIEVKICVEDKLHQQLKGISTVLNKGKAYYRKQSFNANCSK